MALIWSSDEAEGVPDRVQVDPEPTVLRRLVLVDAGAEREDLGFGGVDVTDAEVQMELLRVSTARPGRSHPVIDPREKRADWGVRRTVLEGSCGDPGSQVSSESIRR